MRLRSTPLNDYRREGDDPEVIFEHTKSGARHVIAQVVEFKGHWSLDIREWLGAPDDRVATRRGISVPLGVMRELGQAILAASPQDDCGETFTAD